jgi:hypothetical protein
MTPTGLPRYAAGERHVHITRATLLGGSRQQSAQRGHGDAWQMAGPASDYDFSKSQSRGLGSMDGEDDTHADTLDTIYGMAATMTGYGARRHS